MSTVCLRKVALSCRKSVILKNVFSEESPKYCTASWLQCWIKSQEASDSACFCSHFLLHKQTGILLFKHTLGNKALWKWCEPGAGSSQGVKSTLTARILRFVILPVTALQGVPISKATKVGQSSMLNAKSPFQAELHHPEGILVLSSKRWQPPSAAQASGPGFFTLPRSCLCCPQRREQ